MSDSLQFFIELMNGRSAHEVRAALDDYAQGNGLGGLSELPHRYVGDKENNRGPIEAMESVENAVYEKIMNGYDALIELRQCVGSFPNKPTNAAQALAEIGNDVDEFGVYLITSRSHTRTGSVGQPKKRSNVIVVDEGIGIGPEAFHDTIMSLEGSNKLTNALMAGSYGFGGSAIYRYSKYTIIWSRSIYNPNMIGFTVVYQKFNSGARFPSYVYLVDANRDTLSFSVADLPSDMVIRPSGIHTGNIMEATRLIPVPEHGTGIKVFELENFAASPRIYSFLRDRGFGMPVPCRLRNGVETGEALDDENEDDAQDDAGEARGSTRRLYNATGLRFSFNDPTSRTAYRLAFHQPPIGIMPRADQPQATLECWVLERALDRNTKVAARASEPVVESVLGKERRNTPCYVTLNGMTQENLPTHVLLKNVRLPYLRNHLVVEINCDQMDPQKKGRFFTSSRERLTRESIEWIKEEITKYLTMQAEPDGELAKLNSKYRDAVVTAENGDAEAASRKGMELLARLMKSGAIGTLLSRFGGTSMNGGAQPAKDDGKTTGRGRPDSSGQWPIHDQASGTASQPVLIPVPDTLEIRKHTFKQGASEWVVVRTNGYNDWDDAISVTFPEYLTVVERLPLTNGRCSFYVQCSSDVAVGTKGRIEAVLNRQRVGLPSLEENASFTVIRGTAGLPKPLKAKTALPNIELIPVEPGQPNWEHMESSDLPPDRVAFNFIDHDIKVRVFWNRKFVAFTSALDEIERRYRSVPMSKKFVTDYTTYLSVLTLAALDGEPVAEQGDMSYMTHRMRAEAVTANATMLTLLMAKDDVEEVELAA